MLPNFGPPVRVGIYARNQSPQWLSRWAFVALNATRNDTEEKARALHALGKTIYLYATPEAWTPGRYQTSLAEIAALCARTGARGLIADPETHWQGIPAAERRDVGRSFGRLLAGLSGRLSVGLTSYPLWNPEVLAGIADTARGRIWASPQLYGQSLDPTAVRGWWERWTGLFGTASCIPSVAGWIANSTLSDAAGYRAYLATIPSAGGAIVWPLAGSHGPDYDAVPDYMESALHSWNPAGNIVNQAGFVARGLLESQAGKIALIVLFIAAVGAYVYVRRS